MTLVQELTRSIDGTASRAAMALRVQHAPIATSRTSAVFSDRRHETHKFLYKDSALDCRPSDSASVVCLHTLDPSAANHKSPWRYAGAKLSR
jgi:hypothetical protein